MISSMKKLWSKSRSYHRGVFYRNSLVFILLAASIPGFMIGLLVYHFATHQLKDDISALHYEQMNERVQNIDDQLSYLEMGLSNWAFNPTFGYRLQTLDFVYYFRDTYEVTKSLVVMEGSHALINEAELYIDREQPILFKTEYYELNDEATINYYKQILSREKRMYWEQDNRAGRDSIVLLHKIPGESTTPFGVLLVRVDKEKLMNLLKTMTPYNEGTTFLMNKDYQIMLSDSEQQHPLQEMLIEHIRNNEQPTGQFLFDYGEESYSVSYGMFKRLAEDWIYVSASPMTLITSPVITFSKSLLWISGLSLAIALLLAVVVSNTMYSPIQKLLNQIDPERRQAGRKHNEFQYIRDHWLNLSNKSVELEHKLDSMLPMLRNTFLMQLLQGHVGNLTELELERRMRSLYWEVGAHQYTFIHIYLTGLHRIDQQMTASDERLMTFAAYNMAQEMVAASFEQGYALNFHDLSLGIFIIEANERPAVQNQLQQFCERYTNAINELLRLQVSITISRKTDELRKVRNLYMEIERAASYRQFLTQNQLIHMDDLPKEFTFDDIDYPFDTELEILQVMRSGDKEQTLELLKKFVDAGGRQKERYAQQNMLQLLGSIQHMMLQSGINPIKLFHGENLYGQLSQIRDPNKMLRWIRDTVVMPFLAELESRVNVQQQGMMRQVAAFMHEHYSQDISLDQCAEIAGVSSYTLSKWFKQATGVNFIDYLTELRIKKAQELLRTTDMLINDIAQKVGYQQRYFNRIFKKQVGVTPSEYRGAASADQKNSTYSKK